jgi:hypothetical protein
MTVPNKDDQQQTPEEQYDAAWVELDTPEGKDDKTGLPDDSEPKDGVKPDGTATSSDSGTLNKDDGKPEDSTEKRIKDLQSGFTKVTQENAELKRMVDEFKAGNATKQQVDDQQKKADSAKAAIDKGALDAVYREYPELKEVIDPLFSVVESLKAETASLKQSSEQNRARTEMKLVEESKRQALDHFENNIMPKVTTGEGGHPDFKEIIANEDYWEWAKGQRPGLRTAAMDSSDPEDIKWALAEYKKSRAMPEAKKVKEQEQQKKADKLNNSMALRGGSTAFSPKGDGSKDPNDYDDGWDEAGKLLDRKK